MMGLVLKDLYNLRQGLKSSFITLIILIGFGLISKNHANIFAIIIMISMNFGLSSFSYDEKDDFYSYGLSFPITRKSIVLSRYLSCYILAFISTLLAFIINIALVIPFFNVNIAESFILIIIYSSISILFSSILIPLAFKNGIEKTRPYIFLIAILFTGILILSLKFLNLNNLITIDIIKFIKILLLTIPIILIIIIGLSISICIKIVENKDF